MALGKRSRALLAAGAAVVLALVTACGTSGPGAGAGTSAWALTGGDEQTIRGSFESWNNDNADSAVTVEFFANDAYKQKIRTSIGAGDAPTLIFGWGGGTLRSWVQAGKVADLSAYANEDPQFTGRFLESVLKTGMVGGKTYAVPNNGMQPVLLYYNKELFDRVGAQPPKTWDDLMRLVPVFTEAGIAPFSMGGQSKWPQLMWAEYLVDRIGGPEVFEAIAANEPDSWSHPAILRSAEMIQELVDSGGFVKGFNSIATDNGADAALLYTGKAAMYLMGSWAYPTIKQAAPEFIESGNLGYTTFPTVEGGAGNPADIVGNPANFWAVSAEATDEQRQAAVSYLKDGLMSDSYVDTLLANGSVPPVTGIESKLAGSDAPEYLSYVYDLAAEAPSFQLSWDQALTPKQADALLNNLDQLFGKQITPQQFAANMNKTIEQP
ncbi:sugar ABC transporter substrate-binding protein [Prauserella marina]|uniref:Raffinose/stachyose/melibiose transport system substrate-binding protein n=1 Tax=Prauserella marina TaxID=530584 RepID=A0A222VTJ6_9PSEU|nr:extracellular solute-binding protein [Prauserella marina]ASR37063.1 sugar ABC transporter substrate-binding protein [Prauserella marina]PWV79954.1 carbohydrate ABC transporter substrate-binding protein (CUT1 family) [Prauserella marina]SDD86295.1 raffinose/stachyose/melibiose transport system substrate-binding protein [Prauserella marina]